MSLSCRKNFLRQNNNNNCVLDFLPNFSKSSLKIVLFYTLYASNKYNFFNRYFALSKNFYGFLLILGIFLKIAGYLFVLFQN